MIAVIRFDDTAHLILIPETNIQKIALRRLVNQFTLPNSGDRICLIFDKDESNDDRYCFKAIPLRKLSGSA